MDGVRITDIRTADEHFVGSCTHVAETEEWTAACARRIAWLRSAQLDGMSVKVALIDNAPVGFLYLLPIEMAAAGPLGQDLSVIQCLAVKHEQQGHGVGGALVAAAEEEARRQRRKGLVVTGYYHDFWFMPAPYFESLGFQVASRRDRTALLWKTFHRSAQRPRFMEPNYHFEPVRGKVAVDLFWTRSCLTSDTEAQRVREVAGEFGHRVQLREYCSDEQGVRTRYGIPRAIYVQGQEVGWGYEAPKDGLREAIEKALA
jgi:predicted N-acetyltransferase YhbS